MNMPNELGKPNFIQIPRNRDYSKITTATTLFVYGSIMSWFGGGENREYYFTNEQIQEYLKECFNVDVHVNTISTAIKTLTENGFIYITNSNSRMRSIGLQKTSQDSVRLGNKPHKIREKPHNMLGGQPHKILCGKKNNIQKELNKEKDSIPEEAKRLYKLLKERVIENYPFYDNDKYFKPDGIDVIDKMNRIDNLSWEQIEYLINWSTEDSFWKQNIRSANNLRKHALSLIVKVKAQHEKNHITII